MKNKKTQLKRETPIKNAYIGTRISKEAKEKFQKLANKERYNQSTTLRILVERAIDEAWERAKT